MSPISLLTICLAAVSLVIAAETSSHFDLAGETSGEFNTLVVNGNLADRTQFPWHASVVVQRSRNSSVFCSGSLLSHSSVLTHANCLKKGVPAYVVLGSNLFHSGLRVPVSRYTIHPRYRINANRNQLYNIAVLKLKHRVNFSNLIAPINLPPAQLQFYAFENQLAVFAGFGTNSYHHPNKQLRWADYRVQTIAECSAVFPLPKYSKHLLLCTEDAENTRTHPGFGDIGGALVWRSNNRNYVIGMFARVPDSADLSKGPAGFINIAAHSAWIWGVVRLNK